MLLTNWLNTLTSKISKRRVFRSRDRRDIRKRWQSIIQNQISTTEALEDRTLLTTFFVDDDFTGTSDFSGTDTDPIAGDDQNAEFGFTAFTTIQQAVSAAVAGDTIIVAAGTYTEDVIVNTSVIIQGANAGIAAGVDPGVRGLESELTGGFRLFANDVVIDGFKIVEGAGPAGIGSKSAVFMATGTTGHMIENNILEGPGTGVESRGVLSTFNGNNDNITIQNNEIYNWAAGIHNQGNTNVDIFGNNIHDVVAGVANDYVTDVSIEGNAFSNALEGIGVYNNISNGIPDVAAHDNFFDSLTLTNPIAHYGGDTVDASGNWWGITDATTIANSMKSDGDDGNASKVDFTSYLNIGTDTEDGTAGFQGDFSTLNVTTLGAQTGGVGRIQEAIDLAASGATINIAAGTYNENVNVDKSVTLDGAGTADTFIDNTGNLFTVTADDVSFEDMTLQGATQGIRVNSAVDNLQVDNVNFIGIVSGTYGIEIHNDAVLTNLSVTNSYFSGTGGTGIRMATTAIADGIHVDNTTFDGMRNAINEASNNTVTGGHLRDLQVTNSTFQNISDVSIYAEDMRDSNISGNDFFGNPAGDTERDIVLNNKYSANGMAFGNIQITNNSFTNSDRPAIQLDSRAEAITGAVNITGNTMNSDIGTLTYSWTRIDVNLNSNYNHAPVNINNNSITFTGNASAGSTGTSAISLSGGSDAITISGNTLTDNTTLGVYTTTGIFIATDNSYSGAISPTAVIDISNNIITGFDTAIALYDAQASSSGGLTAGSQVNINNNSLAGNTEGIKSGGGEIVNASNNWWGPGDEATVESLMTGGVDFTSYLDIGTDTDGGTAGFQGDFSVVNVTALGEQTGPLSRIQEAVVAVTSGGTINIASGTYAGNVDATATGIDKSVKLVPGSGPGQVVIDGDLKLDGNDIVDIEVNGTIAGTQYDQFVVNGDLALGGATLNLIDGHTPGIAESFILIKNDGPNPVTGTFDGYPEGHEFTDFLGVAGLSAFLTYSGGDGNDVAIYTEIPSPVVTIPNDGAADEYTLQIIGSNVVITEVGSGNVISNYHLAALGGALVINGEAGENDTLTIDMTGIDETTDLQIIFNGGAGGHDTLELVGGNLDSIEFLYVDPSTGSIRLNNSGSDFISYTGLEPVTSTVNATNVTLTYTGGAEIIDISDLGGGRTLVDSSLGEMTDFLNPTGTLTINAGTGADTINIISLAADYSANIIINGDDAADEINVNSSVSLAAGKSIQFNAEVVELTGDVSSDAISGTAGTVNITGSASGAEIQDAIDLAASGATINIATGTYNENVNVDKSVTLDGAGTADTFIDNTGNLFTVTADDVSFEDMTLQGATQGIRVNSAVDNLQVDNVNFIGIVSGTYGIEIHNDAVLTNLSVTNSYFSGTGGTGIRMATTAIADGIHVDNTTFDGMRNAINEASNNTVAGGHLRDLQVTNSTFQNISDVSIYAEDMRDSNISGNDFFGNPAGDTERDIVLNNKYSANGMAFGNIQITNNSFTNSDRPAIQLDSRAEALAGGVTISGNSFDSDISTLTYSWTRIDVNLNSSYTHAPVAITDNSITFTGNSSAVSTGTSAISLSGGSDAITINGNTLTDNTTLFGYKTTGIFIATDNSYSGAISPTAVIDISNNIITGFDAAIDLYDFEAAIPGPGGLPTGAQLNVTNNSLEGNTIGIRSGGGEIVNASGNWWGINDETAIAALMTGAVDFSSYLDKDTNNEGGTTGFQGDFSTLNVTALGEQTGPAGRIEEALQAVTPGGTININSGTYAGNVDATATGVDKSVTLAPGNSPGQVVINGDLILNGDDTLEIEINGQTAGSGYDQFIVNGAVVLNDAILNLTNTYTPVVDGDKFTLIDNDAADGITGAFIGYPEGHEFTNFLGSGFNAYLTYVGGDGNDVVIHMDDSNPEITVPNNGATDQYTLEIVGGNFVLSETVSGAIISTFPVAAINGPLVIHGEDGQDDTLTIDLDTIDHTTDIQIEFRGGTGGDDALILERTGAVNSVGHVFTSASDGSIFLDGESQATIVYTGLEPIDDQITATDRTFSFTAAADETITLSNYVTVGESLIGSTLGESVNFVNPTGTVTIYTENALVIPIGDGADTINIEGVDAGFTANLTVIAGTNDTVTFLTNTTNVGTGNLDITAGSIALNAAITTSGNVSMNATNGSISGTSLVTATNADLRATGDVGASGTEVELAVDSLEANVTGSLYVDNTGALNIGFAGGINGVTVGGSSTITSTDTMTVTENITATGGDLLLQNTGGDFVLNALSIISNNSTFAIGIDSAGAVTLTDTSTVTSSGTGLIDIDAANDIELTNVNTSGEVQVTTSAGAITDISGSEAALITADTVALRAATGIGATGADDIDLAVGTVSAETAAGDIFIESSTGFTVGTVDTLAGITALDNISLVTGGTLTVDDIIEATGAAATILVDAQGDIDVNSTVETNGGAIDLLAENNLNLNAASVVDTNSAAVVTLRADSDTTGGGAFVQTEGSVVNAQGGALNVTATDNISLADLQSAGGIITIDSTSGSIVDSTVAETALISGGQLSISALDGIGTSTGDEDIETAVGTLAAITTDNDVVISNTGALLISDVALLSGVTSTNGAVSITTASPLTVDSNVTAAGTVTLTSTDAAGAGDDLTINAGVTVESTTADVVLNSGDDFLLSLTGTVRAATTIEINVDPITDGTGATVDLLGNVDATLTTINGGDDNDTFNILPTQDSPITINGGDPTLPTVPGDVLNLDFSGLVSAPVLTLGVDAGSGSFSFLAPDTELAVNYSSIENVNTSAGSYHLVLDMFQSGFQDGNGNTIDATVDNSGTDLILDINNDNFFTGAQANILSFTVVGSTDDETLNIEENANGDLPFFQVAAPAVTGSAGSHLNASANTYLDATYPPAYTVDDITIHYDGGAGIDSVNVIFATAHDVAYFTDTMDAAGSGNITSSTIGGTDIDLGLSFARLEGVGFSGTGAGDLRVDASSNSLTNNIEINDDGNAGDGISQIVGNMQFTNVLFEGFSDLQVLSGMGADVLDLIGLDSTTTLTDIVLNAGDISGTDNSNDRIRVRSTPAGTVTNVTMLGGLGNDRFQLFDGANTVDNIFAAITVNGQDGSDLLEIVDTGDGSGDTIEVTSTTVDGLSSSAGIDVTYSLIDNLDLTTTAGNDVIDVNLGAQEDLGIVTINGFQGSDDFFLQGDTPVGVDTRLLGHNGNDEFIFVDSYVLRGFINGGNGNDTIDYSGYTPVVNVVLTGLGSSDGFQGREDNGSILGTGPASLGFNNIDNLIGTTGSDTLQGPDLNNYWGITTLDGGMLIADRLPLSSGRPTTGADTTASGAEERLNFTSFQNLIGGSQDDRFDLSAGDGLSGTLNGGLGNDSLDYRDYVTGVTVNLFAGTATNIGGGLVAGTGGGDDDNSIENVFGGNGDDNITGDNDNNILGDGLGSDILDGGGFDAGGGILEGGSGNGGNDVFLMEPGAGGSADVITDIHGNDTIDFRFASAGITFDVDIINTPQDVFGGNTVELRQIQPEQPDTNPSFMENVVGSQFDDYIYIDPLSQDGNFPIDGPPVLRSADGQGGTDVLDFDAKGQEVIDTGFSLTADGVGTVQYLNFENITPFEDNPSFIVDNGDPGFTITGDWPYHPENVAVTNGVGFDDDIHSVSGFNPIGNGPAQAFWEFFGLTPGVYRISATWPESSNPFDATDAPFTVYDGARTEIGGTALDLGTIDVDQQVTPDDYSADGTTWEILGTFSVSSRTLTVMLTNLANGRITADAIRIERVSAGPEVELVDVTDALAPPALVVDGNPDGIQFGPTELLTDAVRTFEITNNGSAVLNISNILLPAGYTTDLTAQAIGIGSTISFTITMGSDSFGDRSGIFSFDTDDVDESTFNILLDGQVSNVVVIDNGDSDFSATTGFVNYATGVNAGSNGYEGDISGAVPNDPGNTPAPPTETATWTFTGLAEGNYRVSTTWSQLYNRVTDAPYSINGGAIIDVDQSVAPSSFIEDGVAWFDLSSSFTVGVDGELIVTLTNEASNFIRDNYGQSAHGVIADAIRIEYLPEPDLEITVDGGTVVDDDTGVVDFGSTIAGMPVIKEFTITNLSADDVDVTGLIEFPPGFSIDPASPFGTNNVPVTIAGGDSVTFSIQFDGGTNGTSFGQISFTTGDADENPFNFTVRGESGPATVGINDSDFTPTGTWEGYTPSNVGDPLFLTAGEPFQTGSGSNIATWNFDVEPGRYQVVAHWYVNPDVTMNGHGAASNAPYTIFGGALPVTVLVNQRVSSNDFLDDGINWEYIGNPVEITGNSLIVELTDLADGLVYADEIRIYRVVDPVVDVVVDGDSLADGGTVNFDDTIVGAPVVKTFTVTNYGERNMALGTISIPAGFSIVSPLGSTNLAPGASTTFTLQMNASSENSFSGVVSFGVDSSDANPFNFTVSGSASDSMIIDNGDIGYSTTGDWVPRYATSVYDYYQNDQDELFGGDQPGSNTASWEFTNLAEGTYRISSHWASHSGLESNAQFVISGIQGGDITVTLDQRFAANDFTDAGVSWETLGTFQVAAGGTFTITLLDDGATSKLAADAMRLDILSVGSIAPEIEVQAGAVNLTSGSSSLDLGTAFYGESLFQTFTITNTGTDTLNLSPVIAPAGFSISVPLGTNTLYAGQSTTFEVEFNNTTAAGLYSGTLTIPNDDADEAPFTIDLSATMNASLIIDDGDAGFSSSGGFYAVNWVTYFEGDTRQLLTGANGTATWDFSSLTAGSYTVYATWAAHGSLATNAEYSINAGGPIVVNQRVAPNDLNSDGANWEILGVVNVLAGGSISVELEGNPANGKIRADAIRIERTGPLMAAAGVSPSNAPAITQSDLDSVRDAALNYWKATGLSETQISLLESVNFVLADLPDAMLGGATTTTILIDINAAGYGWFVDDTPFDSSEFSLDADGDLVAGIGSAAFGQMDLLTVMLHEMGHTLGYDDLDSDDSLMGETLDASERRLPEIDDFFSGVAEGDNPLLD